MYKPYMTDNKFLSKDKINTTSRHIKINVIKSYFNLVSRRHLSQTPFLRKFKERSRVRRYHHHPHHHYHLHHHRYKQQLTGDLLQ